MPVLFSKGKVRTYSVCGGIVAAGYDRTVSEVEGGMERTDRKVVWTMKVLLINHFPLEGSGSGTYTKNIALHLRKRGHEVCVIFPENRPVLMLPGIRMFPVMFSAGKASWSSLPFNFPCFTTHPQSRTTFADLSSGELAQYLTLFSSVLRQAVREFQPDVIHAQHAWCLSWLASLCDIPLVVTIHGTDLMGCRKWPLFRGFAEKAIAGSAKVLAISQDNRDLALSVLPSCANRLLLLPNGYNEDIFYPEEVDRESLFDSLGLPYRGEYIVLFAGKLAEFKGVDTAIFATLAQKESESISEKMRWSYRMRMRSGTFLPSSMPYGYNIKDKQIRICPEEAETIKGIFSSYLAGQSMQAIANRLNLESIPRRVSSKTQCWRISTIEYILSNERYVGDSLWQKTYQTRELPHRAKKNKGELEQYFLPDTHLPIIDRETFMKAKQLRLSRKQCPARICEGDILRKRLRCGICGGPFRSIYGRNTHSYECQAKNRGSKKCTSLRTSETQLQQAFLRLYFKLKRHGESVLTQLITDLRTARNGSLLWSEGVVELNKQITDIAGQERLLLLLKQQGAVDPDLFLSRSDQLAEQRRTAKLKKERLLRSEEDHTIQRTQDLLDYLRSGPDTLSFFDEALFSELVEKIIVTNNKALRFRLINGLELTESIERTKR